VIENLPALNACLNATSAVCLLAGYAAIRRRRPTAHARFMLGALTASLLFLVSYVIYHFEHGATRYGHGGLLRIVYFAVLISHTVLAVVNVPLVWKTVARALRKDFAAHKRIAPWTLATWLYVSVTGVLIYFMLYHW
jgi:putative membrane protein